MIKKYKIINPFLINSKLKLSFIIIFIFILYKNNQKNCISFFYKIANDTKSSNSIQDYNNIIAKDLLINITDEESLIAGLKQFSNKTMKSNIIFADWYLGKNCSDKNAYRLFEYYLNNNLDKPYYIINQESDFYRHLMNINRTNNLILFNEKKIEYFYKNLFKYLINAKIIVTAYSTPLLQLVASYVPYIKYLKINHGIKHFKILYAETEFIESLGKKMNVICSSPYEYQLLTKILHYNKEHIHNASLARFERFESIKQNKSEKKCILSTFTWRPYDKYVFEKSKYKKNLEDFLNDKDLISFLKNCSVDLIYIPHHQEVNSGKNYSQNNYEYAQVKSQEELEHYIEQCSLYITDFSSICFDFMFQNKPVLFFEIDKNDSLSRTFNIIPNDTLYFGNYFYNKSSLFEKVKYYVNKSFAISNDLKEKYESVFLMKKKIIPKLIEIINNIVSEKKY